MSKTNFYIENLNHLKQELSAANFNLDAWKLKSSNIFKLIFGDQDPKLAQIAQLHYDYSSWSLRDSSGGRNVDKVLDTAHAIIDTAIFEISVDETNKTEKITSVLSTEDSATLFEILAQQEIDETALKTLLEKLDDIQKVNLLQALLMHR